MIAPKYHNNNHIFELGYAYNDSRKIFLPNGCFVVFNLFDLCVKVSVPLIKSMCTNWCIVAFNFFFDLRIKVSITPIKSMCTIIFRCYNLYNNQIKIQKYKRSWLKLIKASTRWSTSIKGAKTMGTYSYVHTKDFLVYFDSRKSTKKRFFFFFWLLKLGSKQRKR